MLLVNWYKMNRSGDFMTPTYLVSICYPSQASFNMMSFLHRPSTVIRKMFAGLDQPLTAAGLCKYLTTGGDHLYEITWASALL